MVELRLPFTTSSSSAPQKVLGALLLATWAACAQPAPPGCEVERDGVEILQLGTPGDDVGEAVAVGSRCEAVLLGTTRGTVVEGEDADGERADFFVVRWGPGGAETLRRQFGTSFDDTAESVAVDVQGSILAAGGAMPSLDPGVGTDLMLVKLDEDGAERWRVERGEPELVDVARSVVVDPGGRIFAGGMTHERPDRGAEMFLLELDPDGAGERMTYVGSDQGAAPHELGEAVAVDVDGEVVLAGSSLGTYAGTPAGGFDLVLTRLREDRTEAWAVRRGTGDTDAALDVVIDADGNAWVAALSYADLLELALENDGFPSAFLFKFDRAGTLLFARRLGERGQFTRIHALALAEGGGVFAAGTTEVQLGEAAFGGRDGFVARYDADGERTWTHQLGTAGLDEVNGVAFDPRGTVILSGVTTGDLAGTGNAGGQDAFVAWIDVP